MMSDMTARLNDLSYIPLNNEQNEPTQGDIDETSNEPTQAIRNKFEELYASANEELYPSCDYVTRLDFMVKFTYFKVKGKLTDSIINEMLEFFQNVFPTTKGYKLLPSYYAINNTFKMVGLGYESIHACVNNCFLFQGEDHKDKQFCLVCNTSRWKGSNTPGKKVPKKVLRYFSIIPTLQRLYKYSATAKEMTWHAIGKCTKPSKMQHPVDGRAWKNFDTKYLDFAKEPRNIQLGLAVDGFNPFSNLSQSYSMWLVILTTYNLPLWLCMKESSFILTLLIPDPKSPMKDIDVYLRPLIDDLKPSMIFLLEVVCLDGVGKVTKHVLHGSKRRTMAALRREAWPPHYETDQGVGSRQYGEQDRKATVLYEYEMLKATEGELLLDTYIRYLQVINDLKKCGYSKDNCKLNFKFLNNLQPEWKQYATMMRQNKNLMDINIDALYNIIKQNQGDVNDAMGLKKKTVVVTSDPLALIAEKANVSRSKEKVVVSSDSEGSEADDFSELKKITALLAKAFNRRKFYSKPTNNNLRTSSSSQSANKKQEFVKIDTKKVDKKDDEKK
nr:hypothetical protein [Tanacetum cinerariifolium]